MLGKIQQLCSSAIYKQNVSISLLSSDSLQCRKGYYFRAWQLYFSCGKCYDVNIQQLCSSSMHKPNHLRDLVRCIFSFYFGV